MLHVKAHFPPTWAPNSILLALKKPRPMEVVITWLALPIRALLMQAPSLWRHPHGAPKKQACADLQVRRV